MMLVINRNMRCIEIVHARIRAAKNKGLIET